ncbi:MAG: hypothetical protein V4709_03680 [Pseudomonadota bacterium]
MTYRPLRWLCPLIAAVAMTACYGTAGPGGVQPYGVPATGAIVPTSGQEVVHDYGRTCYIQCAGKDYVANCPSESQAVCQCSSQPYAVCK